MKIEIGNWDDKYLKDLSLRELSQLQYVLESLPKDLTVNIEVDGKKYDCIENYIEERTDEFFNTGEEDYKKIVGKCFINENDKSTVVKVIAIPQPEDSEYINFIFEMFEKTNYGWEVPDYIWLQESGKRYSKYKKYQKMSPCADMNISSESMFHLGIDGNLYVDLSCGGDWDAYVPMSNGTFEVIKEEAIKKIS